MKMHTCTASAPRRSIFNLFLTNSQAFLYVTCRFQRVGPTEWCFSICANARSKAKQDVGRGRELPPMQETPAIHSTWSWTSPDEGPVSDISGKKKHIYHPPVAIEKKGREDREMCPKAEEIWTAPPPCWAMFLIRSWRKKKKNQKTFGNAVNPSAMKDMWRVLPKSSRIYYTELWCLRNEG